MTSNGVAEPMNKKQKCGQVIFGGGPMYDEATARKMLQEAVLVSGKHRETVLGFDPDDAALDNLYLVWTNFFGWSEIEITPMIYFARKGDLKMCRYLVSRGASTTKASSCGDWSPMYAAASVKSLDICMFLCSYGGRSGISGGDLKCWTPLAVAAIQGNDELVRWLVMEGALCADDSSVAIDEDRFYPKSKISRHHFTTTISRTRERLVEWAEKVTRTHASIIMFLHGALPPTPGTVERCDLRCFSGHPGIRKNICGFVGRQEVTKVRHLNILQQVKAASRLLSNDV